MRTGCIDCVGSCIGTDICPECDDFTSSPLGADQNFSGGTDVDDAVLFLADDAASSNAADHNNDGIIDGQDIMAFLADFAAGD